MTPLVAEGLNLAIYGMGTVFVFLTMLVLITSLMSKLVAMTMPDEIPSTQATQGGIDKKKLAAISAAVHQHRNK